MAKELEIIITTDLESQQFIAEIWCDSEYWIDIIREHDSLTVRFYPRRDGKPWQMDYEDTLVIIKEAKEKLENMDR